MAVQVGEGIKARAFDSMAVDAMLVDTDVHQGYGKVPDIFMPYLSPHWQNVLRGSAWDPGMGNQLYPFLPGFRTEWTTEPLDDPEVLCRLVCDGLGVSTAILVGLFELASRRTNYEFAMALAAAHNDWEIEQWLDRDSRLRGSIHVVSEDPDASVREIDRVAAHPQMVQVFMPTVTDRMYGEPRYHPIYEAAERHGLPVTFHHVASTEGAAGRPLYFTEWHTLAHPQAAQAQIMSLIVHGVFDNYPDLKAVFLECGVTWVPSLMWRADNEYKSSRREIPWVKRLPSEHMRDSVRLATQPMGDVTAKQFLQLVEMAESDRMFLYASDFPHYDAEEADTVLPKSLPEVLNRRVRYQNAIETYPRLAI